jgi:hypothetical protein
MVIRILLILAFTAFLYVSLSQKVTVHGRILSRFGTTLVFCIGIVAILFPSITNDAAHAVGVGRGTDLLVYILTIAVIAHVLITFKSHQDINHKIVGLNRELAILKAQQDKRNKKLLK